MGKLKVIIALVIVFAVLSLVACFDFVDLSRVTLVSGVLVSVEEGEVHLKLELADTIEGPVGVDIAARKIELSGESVQEALESNPDTSVLRLDFTHTAIIAICNETAKNYDVSKILDEFGETGYFSENILLVLSDGDIFASEEEEADPFNPHRIISFEIAEFIEDKHYSQARVLSRPKVLVRSNLLESRQVYLPKFDENQTFIEHVNITQGGQNDED